MVSRIIKCMRRCLALTFAYLPKAGEKIKFIKENAMLLQKKNKKNLKGSTILLNSIVVTKFN